MKDFILLFLVCFKKRSRVRESEIECAKDFNKKNSFKKNDGKYVDSKAKVDITNKQQKTKSTELLIHKISS